MEKDFAAALLDTIILKALDMRIKELEERFKILESRVEDLEDESRRHSNDLL
jgi:hypothetical protein